MSTRFLEYNMFDGDQAQCVVEIAKAASSGARDCQYMACLNAHSFVVASKDAEFHSALKSANWLVADGSGIIVGAKILGVPVATRLAGPDVFLAVMANLNTNSGSVFFLGASEGTLTKIRARVTSDYPHITIAGTYSPPFKLSYSRAENQKMVDAINEAKPDVLWVGLTAPKQEKWIAQHRAQLDVGMAGAVGAAFDFFAGTVKRSPILVRKIGMEWLHRSILSPGRLGRRNFSSIPKFIMALVLMRLRGKKY